MGSRYLTDIKGEMLCRPDARKKYQHHLKLSLKPLYNYLGIINEFKLIKDFPKLARAIQSFRFISYYRAELS